MTKGWLAAVPLVAACAVSAPPQGTGDTIREIGRSSAAKAGLTPTSIVVDRQYDKDDDDREIRGYLVWMDVEECPAGKAVVRLTREGYVQDIFGRYGCTVN